MSLGPLPDRVSVARAYIGRSAAQLGLPRSLWCANFMIVIERRLDRSGIGSRVAMSFASNVRRVPVPVAGVIVTMLPQ